MVAPTARSAGGFVDTELMADDVRTDRRAIVVLPYTRVRRRGCGAPRYRMSHYTARSVLAGLELYRQGVAARFVLPGEQRRPATSDLEADFLLRQGVAPGRILNLPNLNGTLQQLEAVGRLQQTGVIGRVVVVSFAFHAPRVGTYLRLLELDAELAEVEQTHVAFLHARSSRARVDRAVLLGLPQLARVWRAEQGISRALLDVDRPFGRRAPATRLFKALAGPTVTDIDHGQARVGLVRIERLRECWCPLAMPASHDRHG
ncbi:MAG: YdcF family protein [Chloroflexi bacterium]|nr:YdcF family protein [Chloroflexota bacterium]